MHFIPKDSRGMPLLPYTRIYRWIFFWSFSLELGKLPRTFQKSMKMKTIQRKICRKPFWGSLQWYFVRFCTTDHWLPDVLHESCSRWWYAKDKTVTQYIATLNSLPHREVMLLSSIIFFFLNKVYSGCRKQKLLLGAVEGLHRDGGEASREDIFLYFLQGCCFFHWVEGEGGGDLQAEKAVFNQGNFFRLSTPSSPHAVW